MFASTRESPRPIGRPQSLFISSCRWSVAGEVASEEFENLVNTNKALVLDVRMPKEYAGGHIKTALHVPLDDLETNLAKIPKNREILIHCVAGARAQIAYNLLKGKGFEKARFLNATIEIDKQGKYTIL